MGCHLAVGANSFARKGFVPVDRANEFAPTTEEKLHGLVLMTMSP